MDLDAGMTARRANVPPMPRWNEVEGGDAAKAKVVKAKVAR